LFDPEEDRESDNEISKTNPYNVLRAAVRSAAFKGRTIKSFGKRIDTAIWLRYFQGSQEDRAFQTAQMAAFMQAVFFANRGKASIDNNVPRGCGQQDDPMLLLVSGKTAEQIDALLCQTTAKHRGDADASEYDDMFDYGDVTRLDGGKILVLANPAQHDFSTVTGNEEDDDMLVEANKSDFKSYLPAFFDHVIIKDEVTRKKVKFGASIAKYEKTLKSRMVDWFADDLFVIPSKEQLCEWIARAFATTPEILEYGWSSYPEYYNLDSVQAEIKKRTQGYVPGAADDGDNDSDDDVIDADDVDADAAGMSQQDRLARVDRGAKRARDKSKTGAGVYSNVETAISDDPEDDATAVAEDDGVEDTKSTKKAIRIVRRKKKS
jgi:hypothetical protein